MKHNYRTLLTNLICGLLIAFAITSCSMSKKLNYFNDLPDSTTINLPPLTKEERIIESGDRLEISIGAKDREAASYFVKTGGPSGSNDISPSAGAGSVEAGYLVDDNGNIEFPIIGKIKATGLSAKQLKESLTRSVSPYLKEPLVDVNFVTFRITVLGDVRGPGTFVLPSQRTSLFEALAAAGDLNRSAKRYDIQLYREYNGQRKISKFDLRTKDVLNNPEVFYLKHNDVLYVQSRPGSGFKDNMGLVTSVVSILISVVTLGLTITK